MNDNLYIQVEPKNITLLSRIMEGYEYLGVVTTKDAKEGIVVIRTTPDTYQEVIEIIENLPFNAKRV